MSNKKKSKYALDWKFDLDKGASLSFLGPGMLEILDSLPFYVMLIDKHHRILLANKATRDQLQLEPNDIIGEYCPKVVHGIEAGTYSACPLAEAVEKMEPIEREHFDKDTGRWLRIAIYPTGAWTVDGEEIFFHMVVDITDQKKAEEALRENEEKYRLLLEEIVKAR
jgi:PAS domain S-box-containing protein